MVGLLPLRKVFGSIETHPIYDFLCYHRLCPYVSHVSFLSSLIVHRNVHEALDHPR